MTGFEPATTRTTIWRSTAELHPPYPILIRRIPAMCQYSIDFRRNSSYNCVNDPA